MGENIDKTAFTSSARKKKDSIFLKKFFENEFLKDMEIYQKKTNCRVRGTLSCNLECWLTKKKIMFTVLLNNLL